MAVHLPQHRRTINDPAILQPVYQGVVNRAVITTIKHQDHRASGDGAHPAQHKAVGVTGAQGQLPLRQSKHLAQAFTHICASLAGQHAGPALRGLIGQSLGDSRWAVSKHGPGVTQTKVGVDMPIGAAQFSALRLLNKQAMGHGPITHPMHGHAK
jgi:hypothetical protein